jgi:FimV-like protein
MDKEQLLERYFEHQLSEEEHKILQIYLDTDADFAEEFAFQKNVKQAITLNERAELKQKLQSFESAKSTKKWISKWSVAASIAVVLGAGYWFMNQSPDSVELYDQYYQSYPNVVAPTVRGESTTDLKSQAFYEYDSGNYQKSYELFSQLYANDKDDYALFYSSLSLIELDKPQEAIALMNQFDTNKNNGFTPYFKWYKALSYLKVGEKEKATELLQSLSESQNPQQEQAQKLLKELE